METEKHSKWIYTQNRNRRTNAEKKPVVASGGGEGKQLDMGKGLRLKTTMYETDKAAKMHYKAQRITVVIF